MNKKFIALTAADVFCRAFPASTAVFAIFEYIPGDLATKILLSVLTVAVAVVSYIQKYIKDKDRSRKEDVWMNYLEETRQLMKRVVLGNACQVVPNKDEREDKFCDCVALVSSNEGYRFMDCLRYEFAIVFKWWNEDRSELVSVVRIQNDALERLFDQCNGDVLMAAKSLLCNQAMPVMKPSEQMSSEQWNEYVPRANSVLLPVAVEGFGFLKKVYLHSDEMSIDFYPEENSIVSLTNADLMRLNGMSLLEVGEKFVKIIQNAGYSPICRDR